jgi:hypothetical protein
MKMININIGFGNKIKNQIIHLTRRKFIITKEWFEQNFITHFSLDVKSKYIPELYEDQIVASEILDRVFMEQIQIKTLPNQIRILKDWLNDFRNEYRNLKEVFVTENIVVNIDSEHHKKLEGVYLKIEELERKIIELQKCISIKNPEDIKNVSLIDNKFIETPLAFYPSKFQEYNYIDKLPNIEFDLIIVFRRYSEIKTCIDGINLLIEKLKLKSFVVHGNAGMGKSNLSAHLTTKIREKNGFVIFIKAKSFSGESTDFEQLFLRKLNVPVGYDINEVLEKLNDFGKRNNQYVTIIIDGLNETTFTAQGFSKIWEMHLDDFLSKLEKYPSVFFIATLRTSYIERIWREGKPSNLNELNGFNQTNLESVVGKYFDYYKIAATNLSEADIFYFRTPLFLDLYCKMLNGDRKAVVTAFLGISGYSQVFQKYIDNLSLLIKHKLNLPSEIIIHDGIARCSEAFINNLQAHIKLSDYYILVEGKALTSDFKQDTSIAYNLLEEYLIYIKDSIKGSNLDVVLHTQQEVGGYLLTKALIQSYGSIQSTVESDFFKNNLIGSEENQHQLKDDILKFLVTESFQMGEPITLYTSDKNLRKYLLDKIGAEPKSQPNIELAVSLLDSFENSNDWYTMLTSSHLILDSKVILNFPLVINRIKDLDNMQFEMSWTKFIYFQFNDYYDFIDIVKGKIDEATVITDDLGFHLEVLIWLLETTIIDLRDEATKLLLEFGTKQPEYIFGKVIEFSTINRPYIYERLVSVCYGICLRKQNEDGFIQGVFREYLPKLYELQFGENPKAPNYNYIVIDGLKHLIDLGIYKEVFVLNQRDLEKITTYKFSIPFIWPELKKTDLEIVNAPYSHHNPDPLRMDFVNYTIPRLAKDEVVDNLTLTANIFKRIIQLGYEDRSSDERSKSFVYGQRNNIPSAKVDRLGKKYCWIAYFDYAGKLLNEEKLNVWYEGDTSVTQHYDRLSDVELEVSNPIPITKSERLFYVNLLAHKSNNPDWVKVEQFEKTKCVWTQQFSQEKYSLLYGYLNQKPDESYEVRTYLLIESYLVKKADIVGKEHHIINRDFGWNDDLNGGGSLSKVYFGELYWADNIPDIKTYTESIPSDQFEELEYELSFSDIIRGEEYTDKHVGDIVMQTQSVPILFEAEPGVVEYSWETDSKVFPSLREYIPSPNIGKHLHLRSDPANFQILDDENNLAFIISKYERQDLEEEELYYLRTDLLNRYLEEKDLILMYQIKQFTYDRTIENSDNYNGMKFFFPHLTE